jgi:hypothetical protein
MFALSALVQTAGPLALGRIHRWQPPTEAASLGQADCCASARYYRRHSCLQDTKGGSTWLEPCLAACTRHACVFEAAFLRRAATPRLGQMRPRSIAVGRLQLID